MSQAVKSPKSFTATEALAAYRRVKLTTSSGTAVEYADQSDSSGYIGVTLASAAIGEQVAVALKGCSETFKCMASEALAVGATLYAADDGKVADTSSGNAIGTALEAATAAGDVIEVVLDAGSSSSAGPDSVLVDNGIAALPIIAHITLADADTTAIFNANCPRDLLIIDAWSINTSAGGGTWKLTDGTNDICTAVTTAASDTDIDRAADMNDAYSTLSAGDTLAVVHTGAALDAELYVMCLPV